jgi:hypothetical protein
VADHDGAEMAEIRAQRWFFVVHLRERERPAPSSVFEIQVLDEDGKAIAIGYVGAEAASLEIDGQDIPAAVIEAAKRQPLGLGDYIDESGKSVRPF